MTERALASIVKIEETKPIENADNIEAVRVKGWWVVTQKDEYKVGDLAIYFEIDSWIPTELAPFLSKGKEPREYNGVKGERLRTIKLRGQLSQGLLLPLHIIPNESLVEGLDVTELLNIQKWEPPINPQLAGLMKGNFPSFISKTTQERVQNVKLNNLPEFKLFEATEKLHGSSMTIYRNDGEWGVCSRNVDLKLEDTSNSYVSKFLELNLENTLPKCFGNLAIQGELIGEGINGNQYKIKGTDFYVFDIFDIDEQKYLPSMVRNVFCNHLGLKHVPFLGFVEVSRNVEEILLLSEFKSTLNNSQAEGIVYKSLDGQFSFKAISNKWLLKNE